MKSRNALHRRANIIDRIATSVITAGGIAIIAAVVLILVLIIQVALPLLKPPSAEQRAILQAPRAAIDEGVVALCMDEYRETVGLLTRSGLFHFINVATGDLVAGHQLERPDAAAAIVQVDLYGDLAYSVRWDTNDITLIQVQFKTDHSAESGRSVVPSVREEGSVPAPADTKSVYAVARAGEDGGVVRVDQTGPGELLISQQRVEEDIFGNETVTSETTPVRADDSTLLSLALNTYGTALYAGTQDGRILRWSLDGTAVTLTDDVRFGPARNPVTAMALVFGDISLAAVDGSGAYGTWFPVTDEATGKRVLTRVHNLKTADAGTRDLLQSRRNKMMLRLLDDGSIHLDYPTNERHLLRIPADAPLQQVAFNTRANGIAGLDDAGTLRVWALDAPHPEISVGTLFGPIWYESYPEPDYTWQSSASTDDFEPKFSLVPLIFGSFKGTVYAMLFAVPLALLGAIYTSQFTSRRMQNIIKSTLEIMAAVPSVVIGFLIALWLAPIIENDVMAVLLGVVLFPLCYIVFVIACQPLRETAPYKYVQNGREFIVMIPITLLAGAAAWWLGGSIESVFFSGDFKNWLFNTGDTRYDQRNAIIIAFGLGFAVIPIIFTISEDALSNIPGSLKAASQALGATRWQTVWRVILPTASPGIFAGIIIGFGRAVGETMIVLMATGNTPILDWSPFNGMRTLSANIAVEIPEAPLGGTLYRVLFLSAVLLLVLTSVLNTMAELIRQHLRNKYGLSQ